MQTNLEKLVMTKCIVKENYNIETYVLISRIYFI
jgi:hypothetical protein